MYKKKFKKLQARLEAKLAEIGPVQQKYAVRFEGEECTFNQNSCKGENICHMCFQQLDLLIFCSISRKKRLVIRLLLFLSECNQTISFVALSFSSVHLYLFVHVFVVVCGMLLAC